MAAGAHLLTFPSLAAVAAQIQVAAGAHLPTFPSSGAVAGAHLEAPEAVAYYLVVVAAHLPTFPSLAVVAAVLEGMKSLLRVLWILIGGIFA